MALPDRGVAAADVVAELRAMRTADKDWRGGRTFGLVYHAGEEVENVAREAMVLYMSENGLNSLAFPSIARMQREVVDALAHLLHRRDGGREAAGFMTSGGSESILLAVKAARDQARAERGVTRPNVVLATSAHAAFHKAGHDLVVEMRPVPVRADWRADVDAMADAIDADTALVVGSAPQYPQGVIDPIPEIAELALERGIACHVDACMGGFVLPFMEQLGYALPPWDFRVEGVTSISADVHKLGYSPKGASVLVHRSAALRRYQTFVFDGWLGGLYASTGIQGTKPAAPIAAAWAVMHHLGLDGYRRLVELTLDATRRLVAGVQAVPGLQVLGEPDAQCVAIAATDASTVDVFAVMDLLSARGWHLDRQSPPDSLHATVSAGTAGAIDDLLTDLRAAVAEAGSARSPDRRTDYAPMPSTERG